MSLDTTQIVVRPAGVWDSRAPFHTYLPLHREHLRTYTVLTQSIQKIRAECAQRPSERLSRAFFAAKKGGQLSDKMWYTYVRSRHVADATPPRPPTLEQVRNDLGTAFWRLTAWAIISYSAMFETYVQCWFLNYALSKLEGGTLLTPGEASTTRRLSPLGERIILPSFSRIVRTVAPLNSGLRSLAHIRTDPGTGKEVTAPVSERLNALRTIEFWRDYRNLLVHSSGMTSRRFFDRENEFVEELRSLMPEVPPLTVGHLIRLRDDSFRAMTSVHYNAAVWMNDELTKLSGGRRGHPFAPSQPPPDPWTDVPVSAPPLLVDGDHEPSLRWTKDVQFRTEVRARLGVGRT